MLKKLLKYDLKGIFKFLIIFYALSIFFGILTRIFLNFSGSFMLNLLGQIFSGVAISMMFNIIINNLMRIWVRFNQNLYGDESYLTHTLPVEKKTLYLSKFLTCVITLFVSFLVISLTLFIAYYSKNNVLLLKNILLPIVDTNNLEFIIFIVAIIFILFIEMLTLLQAGLTGIIIGHQKNNHKIPFSVLFGFICYSIIQIIIVITVLIMALFNPDLMILFTTNQIHNIGVLKDIVYVAIFIYTVCVSINYFVNIKLLNKGVNVD